MKLLFDANLSPRLARSVRDLFPETAHVFDHGGIHLDDQQIWAHARDNDFTIITKDSDFQGLSFVRGGPPKVIWLRVGNAGSSAIEHLIRDRVADILHFHADQIVSLLVLDL